MKASMSELESKLEALVDSNTLTEVLNALEGICALKVEHIQTNWQDPATARAWVRASQAINSAWHKVSKLGV